MASQELINKYHVAAPRYTSYPTVPYWNSVAPAINDWKDAVISSFKQSNSTEGISIYIHLPFCENLCTYCGCNTRITKNHGVEEPYIESVIKEWAMYCRLFEERPVIKEIHLGGGTPTFFSPENLSKLINTILKGCLLHPDAEFSFEGHPANTTAEHLQTLYHLGFRRLSLGIQDFNPKVQLIINRIQTYEQVKYVTEEARKTGYSSVNFDLIYGLPLQTLDGLQNTIEKVATLLPDRVAFYSYAHVPWVKPGQRKFTEEHLPSVSEKQQLYETGRKMFTELGYEEIGMDHFALKSDSLHQAQVSGKLHRNFMGYTHQYTRLMIGLGVSSISDTWTAFAQNVKTVEEYTELINKDQFPVFKGHILTNEDLIIRKHILNLMCAGKTSWNESDEICESLHKGFERMQELVKDGLAEMNTNSISVRPAGKRFLRNICMALDARLYTHRPETQLFSMAE